jgi:hypothetical protein
VFSYPGEDTKLPPPGRILVRLVLKDTRRGKKRARRGKREVGRKGKGKSNTRSVASRV